MIVVPQYLRLTLGSRSHRLSIGNRILNPIAASFCRSVREEKKKKQKEKERKKEKRKEKVCEEELSPANRPALDEMSFVASRWVGSTCKVALRNHVV